MRARRSAAEPAGNLRDCAVGSYLLSQGSAWAAAATDGTAARASGSAAAAGKRERIFFILTRASGYRFRCGRSPPVAGLPRRHDPSVDLLQLRLDVGLRQRAVDTLLVDDLLALTAQHEADELPHGRIERAPRRLVDIDVGVAAQRVASIAHVRRRQRDRRAVRRRRDRQDLDVGIGMALRAVGIDAGAVDVHEGAPADRVLVLADRRIHVLAPHLLAVGVRRSLLLLHELLEIGVPLVRPVHHVTLETHGKPGRDVTVGLDLLAGPAAPETELPPGADVRPGAAGVLGREEDRVLRPAHLPGACALGTEDLIELLHR